MSPVSSAHEDDDSDSSTNSRPRQRRGNYYGSPDTPFVNLDSDDSGEEPSVAGDSPPPAPPSLRRRPNVVPGTPTTESTTSHLPAQTAVRTATHSQPSATTSAPVSLSSSPSLPGRGRVRSRVGDETGFRDLPFPSHFLSSFFLPFSAATASMDGRCCCRTSRKATRRPLRDHPSSSSSRFDRARMAHSLLGLSRQGAFSFSPPLSIPDPLARTSIDASPVAS
jgi:hypothetical protein